MAMWLTRYPTACAAVAWVGGLGDSSKGVANTAGTPRCTPSITAAMPSDSLYGGGTWWWWCMGAARGGGGAWGWHVVVHVVVVVVHAVVGKWVGRVGGGG